MTEAFSVQLKFQVTFVSCFENASSILTVQTLGLLAELVGALRGRLYDSNKNLIMATLSTIGSVASAMGPPIEKASKVYCFLVAF